MLKWQPDELQDIARRASSLYFISGAKRKADGTYRVFFDTRYPLKSIHGRIKCLILQSAVFPEYLQGGISDKLSPRGQGTNARIHVGKRTLITEDVENFYPSVTDEMIYDIWHGFFRFPPPVAQCLTMLTTRDKTLPMGAKTSTLLANLVFWRDEHALVQKLCSRGISYTRLIDDITCSSNRDLSFRELTWVIRNLHGMGRRLGLRLKRKKQTIAFAREAMIATKLLVNTRVSLPQKVRSQTRAILNGYLEWLQSQDRWIPEERFNEISGKLSYLKQHHSAEAEELRSKLKAAVTLKKKQ